MIFDDEYTIIIDQSSDFPDVNNHTKAASRPD